MTARLTLLTGFIFVAPLFLPLLDLAVHPSAWRALAEAERFVEPAATTLALALGAMLLAVPAGTFTAVVLERVGVPGRRGLRAVIMVGLFVPLPVYAAAWQAVLGYWMPLDVGGWRPWRQGLPPAIWVHAAAGFPWVVWIVSLGLRSTDPRLEEDAMLAGGPGAVWRAVLWPRIRVAAGVASAWVAVPALTETTVTDVMMVRTFAEEVYTQLVGNPAGVAAAVAVCQPVWLGSLLLAAWLTRPAAGALPANPREPGVRRDLPIPRSRRLGTAAVLCCGVLFLVVLPVASLVERTGSLRQFGAVVRAHGGSLADSLFWSGVAGLAAAGLALAACWAARRSRWFTRFFLLVAVLAWVTPAPLVGLGLKDAIDVLLAVEEAILGRLRLDPAYPPLRSLLYDQPSPVPALWATVVRYFPIAVAIHWPVVRSLPRELLDAAELDGGVRARWRLVVWPGSRAAFVRAAAAVAVLGLGEVIAGKLVQPPGRESFAQELFNAMHYGADATVAAMSLMQIAVVALAWTAFTRFDRHIPTGR